MYVGIHGLVGIARPTSLKWEQDEDYITYIMYELVSW